MHLIDDANRGVFSSTLGPKWEGNIYPYRHWITVAPYNEIQNTQGNANFDLYTFETFGVDQEIEAKFVQFTDSRQGIGIRMDPTDIIGYFAGQINAVYGDHRLVFWRWTIAGSFEILANYSSTILTASDRLRFQAVGIGASVTLKAFLNGSSTAVQTHIDSDANRITTNGWVGIESREITAISLSVFDDIWAGTVGTAPTLTSITPATGPPGVSTPVSLVGLGFSAGGVVVNITGTGVTVSSVVVVDDMHINCTMIVAGGATAGARTVTVTTLQGTTGGQTFTVSAAGGPTLTFLSPATIYPSADTPIYFGLTFHGTGLDGSTPTITPVTGFTFADIVSVGGSGGTLLTATVGIAAAMAPGIRNLSVTTSGGTSTGTSNTVPFTILDPAAVTGGLMRHPGMDGGKV